MVTNTTTPEACEALRVAVEGWRKAAEGDSHDDEHAAAQHLATAAEELVALLEPVDLGQVATTAPELASPPEEEECELHRPDDLPDPGDRCKYCGKEITWVGPGDYDWVLAYGED